MDIRVLRYFLAAAEQQSISGAAQKLHVTQPTLSRQFMELEEELGHTLFVRTNRKLHLTEKGKLFYERAQAIVSLFDRTKAEIRSDDEMTGEIRIASGETQKFQWSITSYRSKWSVWRRQGTVFRPLRSNIG